MVLGKLLGGGTVKAVANVIDELHTSEEEKQQLKNRFEEIQAKLNLNKWILTSQMLNQLLVD